MTSDFNSNTQVQAGSYFTFSQSLMQEPERSRQEEVHGHENKQVREKDSNKIIPRGQTVADK